MRVSPSIRAFKKAPIGDKHIYFLAKKWYSDQVICDNIKKNTPIENFFSVKYEDLLEDPAMVLNNLCIKYDIKYNKDFLNFYLSNESKKASDSGRLWENLSKPLIRNNKEKFKKELSEKELLIFESINNNILTKLGYDLENNISKLDISFTPDQLNNFKDLNEELKSLIMSNNNLAEIELREKQRNELLKSIG